LVHPVVILCNVSIHAIGNMGNAIAAKAVREEESDINVQVAMLAIQIGMYVSKHIPFCCDARIHFIHELLHTF